jgi:hypothetical protein
MGVIRSVSVVARAVLGPFRAPRILSGFQGFAALTLANICRPIRDKMRTLLAHDLTNPYGAFGLARFTNEKISLSVESTSVESFVKTLW